MAWFRRTPLGMLLLSIFLIAYGLLILIPALAFSGSAIVMAILAIAAGVLLLLDR